jgi:hypothetical protein
MTITSPDSICGADLEYAKNSMIGEKNVYLKQQGAKTALRGFSKRSETFIFYQAGIKHNIDRFFLYL